MPQRAKQTKSYRKKKMVNKFVRSCRFCSTRDRAAIKLVHPNRCLIRAVRYGDVGTTNALINAFGLSHSKEWSNGYNLLRRALACGHMEVTKLLLVRGARITSKIPGYNGDTLLHCAVSSGNTEIVSMLLDRNADVNALGYYHYTPLHTAVNIDSLEIVKLLLERSAKIDVEEMEGRTPFFMAFDQGKLGIAKELLSHGNQSKNIGMTKFIDKKCTSLHSAAFHQDHSQVKLLLSKDADIEAKMAGEKTALHIATTFMDAKVVQMLLEKGASVDAQDEFGATALHMAAKFGCTDVVKVLLDNQANVCAVDKVHRMPLYRAAERNHPDIVALLLDSGANVDAKQNYDASTPLHIASLRGHDEVVKLLVERNANLNAENEDDRPPLHHAISFDRPDIVERLLMLGATIDTKKTEGQTALHIAADTGSPSAVRVLLDHGADVNLVCDISMTALDYAEIEFFRLHPQDSRFNRYRKVCDILRQHIIAMMTLGLSVSEKNRTKFNFEWNATNRKILENCRTEVADMRRNSILDTNITFHDVLTGNINQLASYTRNVSILKAFESIKLNGNFPMYSGMIAQRIRQGQQRKNLLNSSLKSLTSLSGWVLPDPFAIELFNHLSNKDLENLTNANPSNETCDT